jgi:hypothetical protein
LGDCFWGEHPQFSRRFIAGCRPWLGLHSISGPEMTISYTVSADSRRQNIAIKNDFPFGLRETNGLGNFLIAKAVVAHSLPS